VQSQSSTFDPQNQIVVVGSIMLVEAVILLFCIMYADVSAAAAHR
jgi:hypothetical protein